MELSFVSDLMISDEIGRGGFGTVYSGSWRQSPAAIKVCACFR
jgi:predicted Ser/Thr protein kinase